MFRKIRATWKAADAAAIVVKALRLPILDLEYDPEAMGKSLVEHVCGARPDLFGFGRHRQPPHPVVTAAAALAVGAAARDQFPISTRQTIRLSLGNVLLDAIEKRYHYDFDDNEMELLSLAQADYLELEAELAAIVEVPSMAPRQQTAPVQPSASERLAGLARDLDALEKKSGS